MFISKYIKNKPAFNNIAIKLINGVLYCLNFLKTYDRIESSNIVIIALHRLGDSIFTFFALRNIVNYHKEKVFLICFSETIPIFRLVFNSVNFIEFQHDDFLFNNRIAKNIARKVLSKLNPSIVYDLTGSITSASLLFNCKAKEIIGINESHYRSIYTKYIPIRTNPHIIDKYLDVVKSFMPVSFPEKIETELNYSGDYILIHPFAGTKSKEWGLNKFIALAEHLSIRSHCVIVSPKNKILTDILAENKNKRIKFVETKSVDELINIIRRCSFFIGNDSGPVHIANLLGKPTFTIYGPTNPDFHKPLNGVNKYIIKELPCSPKPEEKICFTHGGQLGCPSFECMNNLTVEEVIKSVDEFIESVEKLSEELHI